MSKFGRRVKVTVETEAGAQIEIPEALRHYFELSKSDDQNRNSGKLEIYGLSEDTRAQITAGSGRVQLEAGYRDEIETLADVEYTRAFVRFEPPEVVTEFELSDGGKTLLEKRVSVSFKKGTSAGRVFDELVTQLDTPVRDTGFRPEKAFRKGFAFEGPIASALDKVTKHDDLTWTVQDSELVVLKPGETSQGSAVVVSPDAGMIGSPDPLNDELGSTQGKKTGYTVRTLLTPRVAPGDRVRLSSRQADGEFRARRVAHRGDTHADTYETEIEMREA